MDNDPKSPEFEIPDLQDLDAHIAANGGFDGDFANIIQQANARRPTREVPPLHPNRVTISDKNMQEMADQKAGKNLFQGKKKMRCEIGVFNFDIPEQRTEYENMVTNCLQKGWIMARDDWQRTPEGGTFAAVKVLIPVSRRDKKDVRNKD